MLASGLADNHSVTHLDLSHNKAGMGLYHGPLVTPRAGCCRAGREWPAGVLVACLDSSARHGMLVWWEVGLLQDSWWPAWT